MSIITGREQTCGVCGKTSEQPVIQSYSVFGPCDLDGRPAGSVRNTLYAWVQACPWCGYRARRIRSAPGDVAALVRGETCRRSLSRWDCPPLARDFLCAAWLTEQRGRPVEAGWHAMYGAWACDDTAFPPAAAECRSRALELFERARVSGRRIHKRRGTGDVIRADLARRLARFEEARDHIARGLAKRPGVATETALLYMQHLVDAGEAGPRDMDAAGAWRLAATFERVGPIRTLGGAGKGPGHETFLPPTPLAPADAPSPGVAPVFFPLRFFWGVGHRALDARYGRGGWHERRPDRTEPPGFSGALADTIRLEMESENDAEIFEGTTLREAIDLMFSGSGHDWTLDYGEGPFFGWRNSALTRLVLSADERRELRAEEEREQRALEARWRDPATRRGGRVAFPADTPANDGGGAVADALRRVGTE